MATRGGSGGLAKTSAALARLFRGAGFDFVFVETVGAGQDEIEIASTADETLVMLAPGMGDDVQAIKAGMMEIADIFVINKADRPGAEQTANEIEAMLSLTPEGSRPPIFRTVATDGAGIRELADALAQGKRKFARPDPRWLVDHIGIAVRSLAETLPFYTDQMGMELLGRETVARENVNVAMLAAGPSRIELLEPASADSTIARFLDKRGPGLHHVAMRVADLPAVVRRLESTGARLLGAPQRGAGGHTYVFVHPASSGGVLWEIIQDRGR
jgi:LAO/AO transport system kinase